MAALSPTLRAMAISPAELNQALARGDVLAVRPMTYEAPPRPSNVPECTHCYSPAYVYPNGRVASVCERHLIDQRARSRKYFARLKAEGRPRSY